MSENSVLSINKNVVIRNAKSSHTVPDFCLMIMAIEGGYLKTKSDRLTARGDSTMSSPTEHSVPELSKFLSRV